MAVDTAKQTAGMPVYMFANRPGCESTSAGRKGLIIDTLFGYSSRDNQYCLHVLGAAASFLQLIVLLFFVSSNPKYFQGVITYIL